MDIITIVAVISSLAAVGALIHIRNLQRNVRLRLDKAVEEASDATKRANAEAIEEAVTVIRSLLRMIEPVSIANLEHVSARQRARTFLDIHNNGGWPI